MEFEMGIFKNLKLAEVGVSPGRGGRTSKLNTIEGQRERIIAILEQANSEVKGHAPLTKKVKGKEVPIPLYRVKDGIHMIRIGIDPLYISHEKRKIWYEAGTSTAEVEKWLIDLRVSIDKGEADDDISAYFATRKAKTKPQTPQPLNFTGSEPVQHSGKGINLDKKKS